MKTAGLRPSKILHSIFPHSSILQHPEHYTADNRKSPAFAERFDSLGAPREGCPFYALAAVLVLLIVLLVVAVVLIGVLAVVLAVLLVAAVGVLAVILIFVLVHGKSSKIWFVAA